MNREFKFKAEYRMLNSKNIPPGTKSIICSYNEWETLPILPEDLEKLDCSYNELTVIDIPESIEELTCDSNKLISLPELPNLISLSCTRNNLRVLPVLPEGLTKLDCGLNPLENLKDLPTTIERLSCQASNLEELPTLPLSLKSLFCDNNRLTKLPTLPKGLKALWCGENKLAELPDLPEGLVDLWCDYNNLTRIPLLPESLAYMNMYNNPWEEPFLSYMNESGGDIPTLRAMLKKHYNVKNRKRNAAAFNLTVGANTIVDPETGEKHTNPLPKNVTDHMRAFLTGHTSSSGYGFPRKTQNLLLKELDSRKHGAPGVGRRKTKKLRRKVRS